MQEQTQFEFELSLKNLRGYLIEFVLKQQLWPLVFDTLDELVTTAHQAVIAAIADWCHGNQIQITDIQSLIPHDPKVDTKGTQTWREFFIHQVKHACTAYHSNHEGEANFPKPKNKKLKVDLAHLKSLLVDPTRVAPTTPTPSVGIPDVNISEDSPAESSKQIEATSPKEDNRMKATLDARVVHDWIINEFGIKSNSVQNRIEKCWEHGCTREDIRGDYEYAYTNSFLPWIAKQLDIESAAGNETLTNGQTVRELWLQTTEPIIDQIWNHLPHQHHQVSVEADFETDYQFDTSSSRIWSILENNSYYWLFAFIQAVILDISTTIILVNTAPIPREFQIIIGTMLTLTYLTCDKLVEMLDAMHGEITGQIQQLQAQIDHRLAKMQQEGIVAGHRIYLPNLTALSQDKGKLNALTRYQGFTAHAVRAYNWVGHTNIVGSAFSLMVVLISDGPFAQLLPIPSLIITIIAVIPVAVGFNQLQRLVYYQISRRASKRSKHQLSIVQTQSKSEIQIA